VLTLYNLQTGNTPTFPAKPLFHNLYVWMAFQLLDLSVAILQSAQLGQEYITKGFSGVSAV
jgi:hypothetical protein